MNIISRNDVQTHSFIIRKDGFLGSRLILIFHLPFMSQDDVKIKFSR